MSDDKDIGAQSWQYRFALVKICRNGKGKKRVLSSFFPVPVFSRSFPRTSLAASVELELLPDFSSGKHSILSNQHQVAISTINFCYSERFPIKSGIPTTQADILHSRKLDLHATRGELLAWTASCIGVDEVIGRRTPDRGSCGVI